MPAPKLILRGTNLVLVVDGIAIQTATVGQVLKAFDDGSGNITFLPADEGGGGGGGATHGSGPLISRPSVPGAGDTYKVTSGMGTGDIYECFVDGLWTHFSAAGLGLITLNDLDAMRAVLNVPTTAQVIGERIAPTFEAGQGWSLVAATTPSDGTASYETVSSSPVGRLTLSTAGAVHALNGPRIEREFPAGVEVFKATVRMRSRTPSAFAGMYLRNGGSTVVVFALDNGSVAVETPPWNITGPGSAGEVTFDATCKFAIRSGRTATRFGTINAAGLWTPRASVSYFEPTHIGVVALSDGAWSGVADFDQFTLETLG